MIKRFPILILVTGLLLLLATPSVTNAKPKSGVDIVGLVYDVLGPSNQLTLESGKVLVSTNGLMGSGTLACNDNKVCDAAGLDGETIGINQDLQIVIDVTAAGIKKVRGRTRGNFSISNVPAFGFRGTVKGQAICTGASPSLCQELTIEMQVRARLFDPDAGVGVGRLVLDLTGIIGMSPGPTSEWVSLEGSGRIVSDPGTG